MLRSSRTALGATLVCAAGLLFTALVVRFSAPVQARDVLALDSFRRLDSPSASGPLSLIASVGDLVPYLLIGLVLVTIAHVRGRPGIAMAIVGLLAATAVVTQGLKLLLDQGTLNAGTFPSGHATAALTLALCGVLAAPPRLRPVAVVAGAALAAAVSYAIVGLGWHTPTDILGGFLVAATLTGAAVTVLLRIGEPRGEIPARRRSERYDPTPAAVAGLAGVTAVALLAASRDDAVTAAVQAHSTGAAAAAAIAALAATLLVTFARIAR